MPPRSGNRSFTRREHVLVITTPAPGQDARSRRRSPTVKISLRHRICVRQRIGVRNLADRCRGRNPRGTSFQTAALLCKSRRFFDRQSRAIPSVATARGPPSRKSCEFPHRASSALSASSSQCKALRAQEPLPNHAPHVGKHRVLCGRFKLAAAIVDQFTAPNPADRFQSTRAVSCSSFPIREVLSCVCSCDSCASAAPRRRAAHPPAATGSV